MKLTPPRILQVEMRRRARVTSYSANGKHAILCDQFGVLHNGQKAHPQAVAAVAQWAHAGTKVYILSNSSRRAAVALSKIEQYGFDPAHFAGAMTSGEIAHRTLSQAHHGYGSRCLHITWSARGAVDISALGLDAVTDAQHAEVILAHGTEGLGTASGDVQARTLDELKELLRECAHGHSPHTAPPLLLANPDVVTVSGGELVPMPGTLGQYYEGECGGRVVCLGKPAPVIYDAALQELGLGHEEVLAVGDSIQHDIVGASRAGIDSLFIAEGIHAHDTDGAECGALVREHGAVNLEAVAHLLAKEGVEPQQGPKYVLDCLRW